MKMRKLLDFCDLRHDCKQLQNESFSSFFTHPIS